MDSEVRGYRIETCFGPGGRPSRAVEDNDLTERLEKLVSGKNPQLGKKLPGIHSPDDVLKIVDHCLRHFMENNEKGERFAPILNRTG
ncbi:hypothetical protein QUF80_03545 [Desulfococcaceae bacterium HSG8]|nr:hypothetical protein [Desulfococcaceae bacterium HSG8]